MGFRKAKVREEPKYLADCPYCESINEIHETLNDNDIDICESCGRKFRIKKRR
jgi:predicted nucleic acid-binding Zn ribbon protein